MKKLMFIFLMLLSVAAYPQTRNLNDDLAYIEQINRRLDLLEPINQSQLEKDERWLDFLTELLDFMETPESKNIKFMQGTIDTANMVNVHLFAKPINPLLVPYPIKYPVSYEDMVKIAKQYPDTWVTLTAKKQGYVVVSVLDFVMIIQE